MKKVQVQTRLNNFLNYLKKCDSDVPFCCHIDQDGYMTANVFPDNRNWINHVRQETDRIFVSKELIVADIYINYVKKLTSLLNVIKSRINGDDDLIDMIFHMGNIGNDNVILKIDIQHGGYFFTYNCGDPEILNNKKCTHARYLTMLKDDDVLEFEIAASAIKDVEKISTIYNDMVLCVENENGKISLSAVVENHFACDVSQATTNSGFTKGGFQQKLLGMLDKEVSTYKTRIFRINEESNAYAMLIDMGTDGNDIQLLSILSRL